MKSPAVHNVLPKSVKTEYDVKYSELCGGEITIFKNNDDKWGALNLDLELIVDSLYESIFYHLAYQVIICVNFDNQESDEGKSFYFYGKSGVLINELHNIRSIYSRTDEQFPYQNHNSSLWALLDFSFDKAFEPKYDRILPLGKDIFKVRLNNKFGLANSSGNLITSIKYDEILGDFSTFSLVTVKENNHFKIINKEGSLEKKLKFDYLMQGECNSYGGRNNQNRGKLKSVLDGKLRKSDDQEVSDLIGHYSSYSEVIKYQGNWGIILTDGIEILPPIYSYVDYLNESPHYKIFVGEITISQGIDYEIKISGFKCGVISSFTQTILETKYDWIDEVSPNLFRVNIGGEVVYNDNYQEDYWMALGGKWGIVNNEGQLIVPIEYDNIMLSWYRIKDVIIVQNGAKIFNPNMEYSAYELNGKKIMDRKISYLEHI